MDLDQLRAQTPGCVHRIHLNNAGAALMSRSTLEAMTAHLRLEAEIGGYEAAAQAQEQIDVTYAALAQLVGGRRDEVALFDNSTHAWNAAFYSIPLGPGDRILTGRDEYGSNVLAYLQVARRTGAEIVVVPDDGEGQIDVGALTRLVDETDQADRADPGADQRRPGQPRRRGRAHRPRRRRPVPLGP